LENVDLEDREIDGDVKMNIREMTVTGSGSCPLADFGVSGAKTSGLLL
jgi:hypothetical protein